MSFAKCSCDNCLGHLEFDVSQAGQFVTCPHCGKRTLLSVLQTSESAEPAAMPPRTLSTQQEQTSHVQPAPPVSASGLLLPNIADESLRSIQVRSSSGEGNYTVNLVDFTCTCPSFVEDHAMASARDAGRLCKHICHALNRPEILPHLHPICLAMVKEGFGIHPGRLDRDENGNLVYITGTNAKGWLDVFALKRRDGKTYYRFGYNLNEGRWAYGRSPKINEEILFPARNGVSVPRGSQAVGWRILRGVWSAIGWLFYFLVRVIVPVAKVIFWVCSVVLAGALSFVLSVLLSGGKRTRRRRRF